MVTSTPALDQHANKQRDVRLRPADGEAAADQDTLFRGRARVRGHTATHGKAGDRAARCVETTITARLNPFAAVLKAIRFVRLTILSGTRVP